MNFFNGVGYVLCCGIITYGNAICIVQYHQVERGDEIGEDEDDEDDEEEEDDDDDVEESTDGFYNAR